MDTLPVARTPAQAAASRANGSHSTGPVTPAGKVVSAANAIVHGFSAPCALMPGETPAAYEANLAHWFESLRPANAAEAKMVARIADVDFRQARLARVEERLVAGAVEEKVKSSPVSAALSVAADALAAVQGLVALADSKDQGPRPRGIRPAVPIEPSRGPSKPTETAQRNNCPPLSHR